MTLRIERSARDGFKVFALSGRISTEDVLGLKELFDTDYPNDLSGFVRGETGRSRLSEVSKGLRGAWNEA